MCRCNDPSNQVNRLIQASLLIRNHLHIYGVTVVSPLKKKILTLPLLDMGAVDYAGYASENQQLLPVAF